MSHPETITALVKAFDLKNYEVIHQGLSTQKILVKDELYRVHHSLASADQEMTALKILGEVSKKSLSFPEFLRREKIDDKVINVVRWIEGSNVNEVGRELWSSLRQSIDGVEKQSLPLHSEVVKKYLNFSVSDPAIQSLNNRTISLYSELPVSDDTSLIHGDLHVMNVLRTKQGYAVIDWEFAAWGNPYFDLAYLFAYDLKIPEGVNLSESVRALLIMSVWFQRRALVSREKNLLLAEKFLRKAELYWLKH